MAFLLQNTWLTNWDAKLEACPVVGNMFFLPLRCHTSLYQLEEPAHFWLLTRTSYIFVYFTFLIYWFQFPMFLISECYQTIGRISFFLLYICALICFSCELTWTLFVRHGKTRQKKNTRRHNSVCAFFCPIFTHRSCYLHDHSPTN